MDKIHVPPIKIQGIKTKLVPWIKRNVELTDVDLWVEPFLGSGVVVLGQGINRKDRCVRVHFSQYLKY